MQRQINKAARIQEIVFVRGTTEAINLVAATFGRQRVKEGDGIILITAMEHHSNIVPWQLLCQKNGARLRVAPVDDNGELILEDLERRLTPRTRLISVVHISNVLGTINPVKKMVGRAHGRGIPVLLDGAQAVPHLPVDVQALDCDFYAFPAISSTGRPASESFTEKKLLEAMPPYQGGGDMIRAVTSETTFNKLPYKFEAGTPHIAGAMGLAPR